MELSVLRDRWTRLGDSAILFSVPIAIFSVSHRFNELSLIDRISAAEEHAAHELPRRSFRGVVTLSTCNRFEVIADVTQTGAATAEISELLAAATGLSAGDAAANLQVMSGIDAIRHLYSLAAGLESMVVGEREIIGQLRRAYSEAVESGQVTGMLSAAIRGALQTSRKIAVETDLARQGSSLVAVSLGLTGIERWNDVRVLLAGTGAYAGASVKALRDRGAQHIRVWSESDRAQKFAESHGTKLAGNFEEELAKADLVVLCRGKEAPVLTVERFEAARALSDRTEPLPIIDLALSGDADSDIGNDPRAHLITLDSISHEVPEVDSSVIDMAKELVEEGVQKFTKEQAARTMDPVIVGMRELGDRALQSELERLPESGAIDVERAAAAMRRVFAAMTHGPTSAARQAGMAGKSSEFWAAAELVFGCELPEPHNALTDS